MIKGIKFEKLGKRFWCDEYTFKSGFNLIFGGNGAGKTSLLDCIWSKTPRSGWKFDNIRENTKLVFEGEPSRVYRFKNSEQNPERCDDHSLDTMFQFQRTYLAAERSEGQNVMQTMADFLYFLYDDKYLPLDSDAIILIDELDSGLDAVACKYLVGRLKKILKKRPNLQIFITFNQYEMTKLDSTMLNMYTGEWINSPSTYEEYFDLLKTNKNSHMRTVDKAIRK